MPHEDDITTIGETDFRNQHQRFGIKRSDRRYHMALIGKTGMGKSTLMESMMLQDAANGEGFALLDPHGDLAEEVVNKLPTERRKDLIHFNPADSSGRLALNILEVGRSSRHLVVSGVISVFKKIWNDSWGPRMEHILRHALLTLVELERTTLADIPRLLLDKEFRRAVLLRISDASLQDFWRKEFDSYSANFRSEAIAPILNKIGQFLAIPEVRSVISEKKSAFDLHQIMDGGRIFIANLSKGRLGEDGSALLGALLVTRFELAALSRADTSPDQRRDFYLYVDEFPTLATASFAGVLSEARKFRLNLVMAMQFLEQVEEPIQQALLENVGTLIVFRVGPESANYLAPQFWPEFSQQDLMNQERYHVYVKMMIDGVPSKPFSARTEQVVER